MNEQAETRIRELMDKYFDLVWYCRGVPDDEIERIPDHIRAERFLQQSRIASQYPDEMQKLADYPQWQYGFNSGVLAALRWAATAFDESTQVCEETGEEYPVGGVELADEEWPDLDT
jgi:hypothetical protein